MSVLISRTGGAPGGGGGSRGVVVVVFGGEGVQGKAQGAPEGVGSSGARPLLGVARVATSADGTRGGGVVGEGGR